jgi:diguanylate cyclase (GGDEF)-like protein
MLRLLSPWDAGLEEERNGAGDEPYRRLLLDLTGHDAPESEALPLWQGIVAHRTKLTEQIGRDPGMEVAALDYLKNMVVAIPDLRVVDAAAIERLRGLASTDALTGALNRRAFDVLLGRELARAARMNTSTALLVIDVDRFKDVNDQHGHLAGDRVLVGLAALLGQSIRASDAVARTGGDEFVVLLPATEREGAIVLADRIRESVTTEDLLGNGETVTVSIGVGVLPAGNRADLVAAADEALYRAKAAGRDRVAA